MPALGERRDVLGMLLGGVDRADRLGHQQRRAHVGVIAPVDDLALGHRHHHFVQLHARAGNDDHAHAPLDRVARPSTARARPCAARATRCARTAPPPATRPDVAQDLHRALDLLAGQHLERMRDGHASVAPSVQPVFTTRTASAKRPFGQARARRDHARPAAHHLAGRLRIGQLALVAQQRLDLAVDRVGDVDVVRHVAGRRHPATPAAPSTARGPRPRAPGAPSGCARRDTPRAIVASPTAR